MKTTVLAVLLGSSVLVGAPALAQTNDATTTPSATATTPDTAAAGGEFITSRQPEQFLASNIRGANVVGPQNENIGTVSDMIVDKDGRLAAVTVDVGGFLGIGAKTVALPVQGLEFVPVSNEASGGMASNNAAAPAGTGAPAAGTTNTTADPAVTGSTTTDNSAAGGSTPAANGTAASTDTGTRIDHIKVNFTRDQLQNAPEFDE